MTDGGRFDGPACDRAPSADGLFDVFLSHNSRDKPAVRQLAGALKGRGLKVWLDEEQLVPGRPWQEALERVIQRARTAAVLVGNDGLGPWEAPEMYGCLLQFVDRDMPVIPVLLPDAPSEPTLPLFLRAFTWVDLRGGLTDQGLDRLEWGITGNKPDPLPASPAPPHPVKARDGSPPPASPAAPTPVGPAPPAHPFDPWAIALPPVFVGRTGALRDLERAAWEGRGVSLLGEWRIGKTSLLHTWGERARELGFAVRLLSGQGRERQGHQAFVDAVVAAVPADPRAAATGSATGAAGGQARSESTDAAANRLGDWCSAQRETSGGLSPLLLLDEAEYFLERCEPGFLQRVRGLLTKRRLSLVFATRRTLPEVYADLGRVSPFANMLEPVRIGLLEPGAAAALLARGTAGLAPDDPAWLLDQAGRHPFFLTLLARRLFDARADGPDPDGDDPRAQALLRFRDEAAQQFALWWPGLAERDRQRLRRAAAGGMATDADHNDDELRLRGLLTDGYQPFARVLSEWLKRKD